MTVSSDVSIESLYDLTEKDSYRTLYLSVILQALLDVCKPKIKEETTAIKTQRDQANAWFFSSIGATCEDFETVCHYAKVDPTRIRIFAYESIKSGDVEDVRRRFQSLL
jgi:hypothetical protein|tara:strand:- start:593 stop:919 length:327 start_codon:yes stop_codon:yes gene_type:complete